MTPQEIFDTVARHLFTQGERAGTVSRDDNEDSEPDFFCKYRAPGGRSCAVGVLIPDKAYREDMEGTGIMGVYTAFSGVLPGWMADNLKLLTSLQSVHDDYHSWKSTATLREALFIAADFHGLDVSVLEGLALIKSNVD